MEYCELHDRRYKNGCSLCEERGSREWPDINVGDIYDD